MKLVTCPHCGHKHIVTSRIPLDVVVVLPCPSCHDFVVFYRERTLGMKRDILEAAEPGRENEYIAEALSNYLASDDAFEGEEAPIIGAAPSDPKAAGDEAPEDAIYDMDDEEMEDEEEDFDPILDADDGDSEDDDPAKGITRLITSHEINTFIESELPRIDDPNYFNRTFRS